MRALDQRDNGRRETVSQTPVSPFDNGRELRLAAGPGLPPFAVENGLGRQGRQGSFGPTKIGQSTSFSSIGSSTVANPRKVPLTSAFHETRRIRGHSARSLSS